MRLIDELERQAASEASVFRAQLLREDVARLRKLAGLARTVSDAAAIHAAARRLGWTALDARTSELAEPLGRLVDAVLRSQLSGAEAAHDQAMFGAWHELARLRLERMVGCLSTRLPEPEPD